MIYIPFTDSALVVTIYCEFWLISICILNLSRTTQTIILAYRSCEPCVGVDLKEVALVVDDSCALSSIAVVLYQTVLQWLHVSVLA